ncbi:hypothetical protein AB1L30_05265 [Bremerella sp. JC817]|uniref:hypothetical protein n=1 Tax=Bremerella sp. JC817 TaxID=3231756 RepID=UPI00345793C6
MDDDKVLWQIKIPATHDYAQLYRYYEDPEGTECEECGAMLTITHERFEAEWSDGSDQIGDFVFSVGDVVVRADIASELLKTFRGATTQPVELADHPNLYRPKPPKRTRVKRVWLPYEGPELVWLKPTHSVPLLDQSTVEIDETCDSCGTIVYEQFLGVEAYNGVQHTPRDPDGGLFISAKAVGEHDLFGVECTGLFLVTNQFKQYIEKQGYTNIRFLNYGTLVS